MSRKFTQGLIALVLLCTYLPGMATETGLVQFQPTAQLLVTTDEKAQGITNKYLVTIDAEALYQSANVGPFRKDKISPTQQDAQGLLLFPEGSGFKLNTSIRLQPDRYGQFLQWLFIGVYIK